jgi:TrmH family RNA methyltransferase
VTVLSSKDNPKVRHWRKLAEDRRYRRAQRRALIEGPHLLQAAVRHGYTPLHVLATEEGAADPEIRNVLQRGAIRPVLLTEALLRSIADAESPQGVAAEIAIPDAPATAEAPTVFLEGVQDPANVGAIVRTAAAFGVRRVVLDQACADPWSPKALRAGMGGHFALQIEETKRLVQALEAFKGTLVGTLVKDGVPLAQAKLDGELGWIFGGEGRGVSETVLRQTSVNVTIPLAPATESLNVAAAVAVCLYEASRKSGSDPDFVSRSGA